MTQLPVLSGPWAWKVPLARFTLDRLGYLMAGIPKVDS